MTVLKYFHHINVPEHKQRNYAEREALTGLGFLG